MSVVAGSVAADIPCGFGDLNAKPVDALPSLVAVIELGLRS